MANEPILGYWGIRGLGETIRLLLRYKKVKFVDKRYTYGQEEWSEDKPNLGLDFPNLPYYIDGNIKISQSKAILRYLACKHGLSGQGGEEHLRIAIVEQQLTDFWWNLTDFCYGDKYESGKEEFIRNVPFQLKQFETFLGDRKFMAGDNLTYVDFMAYETFDFYRLFIPGICRDFPKLRAFQDRFRELPQLKEYFHSPTYKALPIFTSPSHFGGPNEASKGEYSY